MALLESAESTARLYRPPSQPVHEERGASARRGYTEAGTMGNASSGDIGRGTSPTPAAVTRASRQRPRSITTALVALVAAACISVVEALVWVGVNASLDTVTAATRSQVVLMLVVIQVIFAVVLCLIAFGILHHRTVARMSGVLICAVFLLLQALETLGFIASGNEWRQGAPTSSVGLIYLLAAPAPAVGVALSVGTIACLLLPAASSHFSR